MNPTLKNALIYSAKNAVNALLTNASMTILFPQFMQWHTADWWWNVGKVALSAIISREVLVWGPKLLKWSTT
jgi:hypothetical protein